MTGDLIAAARNADWAQVLANGGPPCFHFENGHFCLRAHRWDGHVTPGFHPFVSLADLLASERERYAAIADEYAGTRCDQYCGECIAERIRSGK